MSPYIMWVTILDEVSAIAREKKKWNVALGGMKVSVMTGVYFSHLFMRFVEGLAFVRYGGVSVIARCLQGDIRLYFAILKGHDNRLT